VPIDKIRLWAHDEPVNNYKMLTDFFFLLACSSDRVSLDQVELGSASRDITAKRCVTFWLGI
jgi:hypothetical protein